MATTVVQAQVQRPRRQVQRPRRWCRAGLRIRTEVVHLACVLLQRHGISTGLASNTDSKQESNADSRKHKPRVCRFERSVCASWNRRR